MFRTFLNAFKIPELKKKLLFTGLILVLYRIGACLPVPFVDASTLTQQMELYSGSAFSLLNETRKRQLVDILSKNDLLPIYYPEDAELYLRAGRLPGGEIFAVAFNLSQDALDELPLVIKSAVSHIDRLNEQGERIPCDFEVRDNVTYVKYSIAAMEPLALIIA